MNLDLETRTTALQIARGAVIGVTAARLGSSELDAALMIEDYRDQTRALGLDDATSWAMLFSASVVALAEALTDAAEDHHQSPSAELAEFALRLEQT